MADVTPNISSDNLETYKDYLNYESQLKSLFKERLNLSKDILHNLNLEKSMTEKISRQEEILVKSQHELQGLQKVIIAARTIGKQELMDENKLAHQSYMEMLLSYNKEFELIELGKQYELKKAQEKYDYENRWYNFAKKASTDIFGLKSKEYDRVKAIGDELAKQPVYMGEYGYALGALLVGLEKAVSLFIIFDKAAWNFRMAMGMTRNDAKDLRNLAEKITIKFMDLGVTLEDSYKSIEALGKVMGSIHRVTEDLVKNVTLFKSQFGVSEDISVGFLRNMAGISGGSMKSQESMMDMAKFMASAAGIPLDDIMRDVATKSSTTLTMMSRFPMNMLKTAIEARRLNTDMNEISRSGRSMLDFDESINAEMEASVLLGHSLNLQRIRELEFVGKQIEANKLILQQARQQNIFTTANVFQRDAFAKAMGMSYEQLLRMNVAEKEGILAKKKQEEAYNHILQMSSAEIITQNKLAAIENMRHSNQDRMTSIQNKWNQIVTRIAYVLFPYIDKSLEFINNHLETILAIGGGIFAMWSGFKLKLGAINFLSSAVGQAFKRWAAPLLFAWNIYREFEKSLDDPAFMKKDYGSFWKNLIYGMKDDIVNGFLIVGNALDKTFFGLPGKFSSMLGTMYSSLEMWAQGVGHKLLNIFIGNFNEWKQWMKYIFLEMPYNFVMKFLGGHSPSGLGLSIVKGLISVGSNIFDALTGPFRRFLAWIADKIPGMGSIAEKLRNGMSGINEGTIEKRATYVPVVHITPEGTKLNIPNNTTTPTIINNKGKGGATLDDVVASNNEVAKKLDALLNALKGGQIGVSIDGQLLSATLARSSEYYHGFGTNKI